MTNSEPNLAWGERAALFPKRFGYVFSLDVAFELPISPSLASPVPMHAIASKDGRGEGDRGGSHWDTFHVLGEEFIRTADGVEHQYPRARLKFGKDALAIRDAGTVSLDGTLLFETDTPDRLSMRYQGVLTLDGGTLSLCRPPKDDKEVGPSGKAFIASTQDVVNPKYRWMVQNRLVGVGRVSTVTIEKRAGRVSTVSTEKCPWHLIFDYDFYIAS